MHLFIAKSPIQVN